MEKVPLNNVGHDFSFDRDIGIITAVLESGNSVELPASGYSMFPTLRSGDRVVVKPLAKEELPMPGSVVVCMDNSATVQQYNGTTGEACNIVLVMHRLVELIADDSGKILYITRGDSGREPDKPWHQKQLLGVAISYKRRRKERSIKTFTPGAWRYLINHRLLWMFNKIMRLTKVLDKEVSSN